MRLWLWDAAAYRGVTDDEAAARDRAVQCLRDGGTARVELAFLSASFKTLTCDHIRTGVGWTATRAAGTVTWQPLAATQDPPARASWTPPCPRTEREATPHGP